MTAADAARGRGPFLPLSTELPKEEIQIDEESEKTT